MLKLTNRRRSFLSDGVYYLVFKLNEEYERSCERNEANGLLQVDDKIFFETFKLVKNDGCINFIDTVKGLLYACHNTHRQLMQLTTAQFNGKFGMDLEWTGCRERIINCFNLLRYEDPSDMLLSFLMVFAILEHALGDVYISYTGSRQCPPNLKDLVMAKEMHQLLGESVTSMIYVLAGPPDGVNLRNVLWHGFASSEEIPPQYGSFLLFMMASMSSRLNCIKIKRRPLVTYSQMRGLTNIFPVIKSSDCAAITQVFTRSLFVSPTMLPIWKAALKYYQEKRHDLVVVLLLPQLEHALRMVFTCVNKCPERILTAESTTLYTTFDEILASSLPGGSENQIRRKVGDEHLEMLFDILVHNRGPRLRDHISHGEANLNSISSELSNHVLCVCIAFAALFIPRMLNKTSGASNASNTLMNTVDRSLIYVGTELQDCQMIDKSSKDGCSSYNSNMSAQKCAVDGEKILSELLESNDADIIHQVICIASKYQSVYHPIQLLKTDVTNLSKLTEEWYQIPLPDETAFGCSFNLQEDDEKMHEMIRILCENTLLCYVPDIHGLQLLLTTNSQFSGGICVLCSQLKVPTLYRPRGELEAVSLFSSIVQHLSETSTQIIGTANQRYQQWKRMELRTRQRTNYKRLLVQLSSLLCVIKMTLVFILTELPSLSENTVDSTKIHYIKFLKHCLQCSENLASLSGHTKNKWDECKAVSEQLLHLICKDFF